MSDATNLFRDALQSVYGQFDWLPVPDGEIHRFRMAATSTHCPPVEQQEQKELGNE